MPGVVAVYTADDLGLEDRKPPMGFYAKEARRPFLARDRVRFVGEPIAVVVAETAYQAADAAEAVWADIEALPVVVSVDDAVAADTVLFDGRSDNVMWEIPSKGTIDFSRCETVVTEELWNSRVAPVSIEPRVVAADYTDGKLTCWASSQGTHGFRDGVAVPGHGTRRRTGAGERHRRWIRRQGLGLRRGDRGGTTGPPAGTPSALGREPHREPVGLRPRTSPGPDSHPRRDPGRTGHSLPPQRGAGLRGLPKVGGFPPRVHPQPGHRGLRHRQCGVFCGQRGHQHGPNMCLPGRRPAGGYSGHRASHGPVRRGNRNGPHRGTAGQLRGSRGLPVHHAHRHQHGLRRL